MTSMRTLLILSLVLFYPLVHADADKTGIPFRVSDLEEMTSLQQDQLDELSKWVIVAHPESAPEIIMGKVVTFTYQTRWVVVEADISGESVLLWVHVNGFIRVNSTLFFPEPGCSGQAHATVPHQWYKQISIATDLGDSVVPYKPIGEPIDGHWLSQIVFHDGSGICEDGDFGSYAAPAEPLAGNLYELYPRAPEPWSLEER